MSAPKRTALILGATGGVGGETARALLAAGWSVKALTRRPAAARDNAMQWIVGDALEAGDVLAAAAGVQVIVHAVNPPGYKNWETQVLPMIDNTIAAARASGARIVLPGTIYNYGDDAFPDLTEDAPQHPVSRKGAIRVELEKRMARAARDGIPSLILRCGDFYSPRGGSSWLSQGVLKPGKPLKAVYYPGPPALKHAWAYLPDVAATLVALLDRDADLPVFARFHFAGHSITGHELAEVLRRVTGQGTLALRRFPWSLVTLGAPFVETLRELRKMRYLWEQAITLNDTSLRGFLGHVPATPVDEAIQRTLDGLGIPTRGAPSH